MSPKQVAHKKALAALRVKVRELNLLLERARKNNEPKLVQDYERRLRHAEHQLARIARKLAKKVTL